MAVVQITLDGIHHEKFGTLTNLKIELPLFVPTGKLSTPLILSNKLQMDSILKKNLAIGRKIFEELDDDTILIKMTTSLILTEYMDDSLVPESTEHTFVFRCNCATVTGSSTDEILEAGEEFGIDIGYKQFVKRASIMERFTESCGTEEEELENLKKLIPVPAVLERVSFLTKIALDVKVDLPDVWERLGQSNQQGIKAAAAMALALDKDDYSEETLDEIQSFSTSPISTIEILAAIRNLTIDTKIRDSYLFQRVLNRFAAVNRGLFNLTFLEDDVDNNRNRFNSILRRAQSLESIEVTALEAATVARVNDLKVQLKDLKVIITKLEKTYPLNEHLSEYLELVQMAWDAQLLKLVYSTEFEYMKAKLIN